VSGNEQELRVAVALVREAGRAILNLLERAAVSTKADGSVVTEADYASDAAIRTGLRAAFPDDAILTEEGADDPARLSHDRCWIADPIDGTAYFVARSDDFDVFLALAVAGRPVVAVSYQPVTGLLLGAVAGGGTWIERPDAERAPLVFRPNPGERVIATKGWAGAPENLPMLRRVALRINRARVVEPTRSLCARALLPGAAGIDAIAAVPVGRPVDSWEWDVAAVDLIVREAGGASSDPGGQPLRFNQPKPLFDQGFVIANDPEMHRQIVTILAEERDKERRG
jgi:3'-phosphoadenosine 5'-phosphosulfate (PAPS) 3'-phosphatase